MTLAESLARKAVPCSEDRLCKHPGPMMGGQPRDLLHSYRCPARLRPAIQAAIEEAIRVCALIYLDAENVYNFKDRIVALITDEEPTP